MQVVLIIETPSFCRGKKLLLLQSFKNVEMTFLFAPIFFLVTTPLNFLCRFCPHWLLLSEWNFRYTRLKIKITRPFFPSDIAFE